MIHPSLYRNPVMLDARAHRDLKVARTADDWSVVQGINAIAVAALEFADAAVDFPIVFVRISNEQGEGELVPVAVFGLTAGENLYVQGSSWRARYVPAMLRMYPFGVAGIEDDRVLIAIDEAWPGWSRTEGEPVFDASAPSLRVKGRKISNWCANLETCGWGIHDSLFGMRLYPIAPLKMERVFNP
jgi:predicted TIM-barrel fold metal-dependent hydrolase